MPSSIKDRIKYSFPVLVYWVILVIIGFLSPYAGKKVALEAAVFLVLLISIWNNRLFHAFYVQIPSSHKLLLAGVIGLILIGQMTSSHRISHPFPEWSMYCGAQPRNTYNEYMAKYPSGVVRHFPFHEIAPASSVRGFMGRFNNIIRPIKNLESLSHEDSLAIDSLNKDLRTALTIYHARNPGNPIHSIQVNQRTIPIKAYSGPSSVKKTPILYVTGGL